MSSDNQGSQSRRRLLASAAAGVAVLAADRLGAPSPVAAIGDPALINVDNPTTALTSITQGTADTGGLKVAGKGKGIGVEAVTDTGTAVKASTADLSGAAVAALQGDPTGAIDYTVDPFGVYAYSGDATMGAGVVGDAAEGFGVLGHSAGLNGIAVAGIGTLGGMFMGGDGLEVMASSGTGLHVHAGAGSPAAAAAGTAIYATVGSNSQIGLQAHGRIRFPNRSGRATIGAGHSSVSVAVPGMTSSNFAMAVLNSNRSGRWVRSVVCASGKITIYLNTTVTSTTTVAWLVLG